MYINSINIFRGIAILFIVFGHSMATADFAYNSIAGNTMFNLTIGGTLFFVFISGFMFHHIFYKKFEFNGFLIKKTKYVLFPYLILSTIPIVYLLLKLGMAGILSPGSMAIHYDELLSFPVFRHYFTGIGESFIGYWYIPFIMIIFAMSPLFVGFIKLKLKTQLVIAIFLLMASLFMHRGIYVGVFSFFENVVSVFQNVLFFTPIYMFGILFSEKKELIYSKLTGKEFYILSIAIALALFQAYLGKLGNYHKAPFTFDGIDFMMLQKILLCLFFMVFLNRFENYKFSVLEIIAKNSFGVFFIHGIVIIAIGMIKKKLDFSFTSNSWILYFLVASLVFFLSLMATLFVKRIFPKYSRYLVGTS